MFVFICFVWGTTWLAMKVGIATVAPGVFAGLRWTIAGAVLLAFRRFRGQRVMPPPRLIPRLVFVSIILITLNQVIQLYALKHITAGLAAVISSALTPLALLVFSVAAGQERFSGRQLGAIIVGVAGVFLLFGPSAMAGTLDVWEMIGAAGVTIGCLCYTAGSVMTRPIMRTLEPVQLAGLTDLIGGAVMLLAAPGDRAWRLGLDAVSLGLAGVPGLDLLADTLRADVHDDVFSAGPRLGCQPARDLCVHLPCDRCRRRLHVLRREAGLGRRDRNDADAGRGRAGVAAFPDWCCARCDHALVIRGADVAA
jgi:drug/metabolite transporter (DMT)-like permease